MVFIFAKLKNKMIKTNRVNNWFYFFFTFFIKEVGLSVLNKK